MKRLLKKCLKLLIFGAIIIAGGLYIWVITILLENDNWVGISALTTMLLAIAAFWSIKENRRIRADDIDREHKREALKQIGEWAKECIELFYEYQQLKFPRQNPALYTSLRSLWVKADAMDVLAQQFHQSKLVADINEAVSDLDNYYIHLRDESFESFDFRKEADFCEKRFTILFGHVAELRAELKL